MSRIARIGVISDTHGVLHPAVADVFANVDAILHAGDIGGAHVLDALRRLAPVTSVDGNNDDATGEETVLTPAAEIAAQTAAVGDIAAINEAVQQVAEAVVTVVLPPRTETTQADGQGGAGGDGGGSGGGDEPDGQDEPDDAPAPPAPSGCSC